MEKRGRTRWSAPTRRGIGLCGGQWVKGPQAGWKAGRRLESLPHKCSVPHKNGVLHFAAAG